MATTETYPTRPDSTARSRRRTPSRRVRPRSPRSRRGGAVDDLLDGATRAYLDRTVEHDPAEGVVRVPRVFLWFRGDFGGGAGIRTFLEEHDAVPPDAAPRIRYLSWDWTRTPGAFVE